MTETTPWNDATDDIEPQDEWKEIEAENQIILEGEGEGFIGRFMGMDPPNSNGIIQCHWNNIKDLDGNDILDSGFMNVTHDLKQKLKKVPIKAITRIVWVSSLDTGHVSGNLMRVFKVQWRT